MKIVSLPVLEFYRSKLDYGLDFDRQVAVQQALYAQWYTTKVGISEHTRIKTAWDGLLLSGNLAGFSWVNIKMDAVLPIVTSGAFYPEVDFNGNRIQALNSPIGSLSLLSFNVIAMSGSTNAVFGWLDNKRQSKAFLDSLIAKRSDDFGSRIIQFCFDSSDNVFVRPSWWASLNQKVRGKLIDMLRNSTPGDKKSNNLSFIERGLAHAEVTSITSEVFSGH